LSALRARAFRLFAEGFALLAEAECAKAPRSAHGPLRMRVQAVLDVSAGPLRAQEIAERLGASLDSTRAALSRCIAAGRVRRQGRDLYQASREDP
jgi:hypothetical protein